MPVRVFERRTQNSYCHSFFFALFEERLNRLRKNPMFLKGNDLPRRSEH